MDEYIETLKTFYEKKKKMNKLKKKSKSKSKYERNPEMIEIERIHYY